jgi:hypothetical protein
MLLTIPDDESLAFNFSDQPDGVVCRKTNNGRNKRNKNCNYN